MGLLILVKFNSILPLGILFINPSFSILLNAEFKLQMQRNSY